MFDLRLTAEQLATQQMVRNFVNQEIKPIAVQLDLLADFESRFPWDVVIKASKLGLRTFALSKENGGGGADTVTGCIITEELAVGDLGIAVTLGHTAGIGHHFFDTVLNAEQRQRFLPEFLADDTYHLALALHEPDTDVGYDYYVEEVPSVADKTNAVQNANGDWVINGVKSFQTNGTTAKLIFVRARIDQALGGFLVPTTTKGLTRRQIDGAGRRLAGWAELYFDNCVVPAGNILGTPGAPGSLSLGPSGPPRLAATNVGVGRAAYEAALEYAKLRVQGGKPIVQHQAVGSALAEMAINLQAARALAWQAAWASDHPQDLREAGLVDLPLGRMAQLFATEVSFNVTVRASRLFGGAALSRELPLQKYIRDASVYMHAAPRDIGNLKVAEALVGYKRRRPLVWAH